MYLSGGGRCDASGVDTDVTERVSIIDKNRCHAFGTRKSVAGSTLTDSGLWSSTVPHAWQEG